MTASHVLASNLGTTIDLTSTGYGVMYQGVDFGAPSWSTQKSGPRGLLGALPAYGQPDDRTVTLPIICSGSGSADTLAQKINALIACLDEIRRGGGSYTFRPKDSSDAYRVVFDVLGASYRAEWTETAELGKSAIVTASLDCAPLAEGDPFDYTDTFGTNTIARYTIDSGTTPTVTLDQLAPGDANATRVRYTQTALQALDDQATLKIVPSGTVTNLDHQVAVRMQGTADTMLVARVIATHVQVGTRTAGVYANLGSAAFVPNVGSAFWLRARAEGGVVSAEAFMLSEPTPMATPTAGATATLTAAQQATFAKGYAGFRIDPHDTVERYDDFKREPYTYRNVTLPEVIKLPGGMPGSHGPRFDLEVTPSGGSNAPAWGMFGWWARPRLWNMVYNGDFEDSTLGGGSAGWDSTSFSLNSGGGLSRVTTAAKYGTSSLQIAVSSGAANRGGCFPMYRRFKRGRTYLAWCWVRAASGTNSVDLVAGSTATDNGATTTIALSTAWQLMATTWRPTADREGLFGLASRTNSSVTQTWTIDGVGLCETVATTLGSSIASTSATSMTVTSTPDDVPALPALAVVSAATNAPEMVRVTAISGTTWTIERGAEGSTAATHSSGAEVCFLPELRTHLEGRGAQPVFGIIEGEGYCAVGGTNAWAATSNGSSRGGYMVLDAALTAGVGNSYAEYLVDPALTLPDDYTQAGEVLVEVYGRVTLNNFVASPVITLSAASQYTQRTYSLEYRDVGKALTTVGAGVFRLSHLGTIALPVDPASPQRWTIRADFSWSSGTTTSAQAGIDYLVLVPPNQRAIMQDGATAATVPDFVGQTSETVKRIRSDLTTTVRQPPFPATRDFPMGGATLELPYSPRGYELVAKLSSLVPDDPTVDSTTEQQDHAATIHLGMTTRYAQVRDA